MKPKRRFWSEQVDREQTAALIKRVYENPWRIGHLTERKNMDYVIVCLKRSTDSALVFWRPGNSGYTERLEDAGRYSVDAVDDDREYYNNGMSTLAVGTDVLDVFIRRVDAEGLEATVRDIVQSGSPAVKKSPIPTSRPTDDECKQHYTEGVGDFCLVCENQLYGGWTDYNGEIKCGTCGTTYQILGCHLNEKTLASLGITKEQVAKRYCECFQVVPLLREYWQETLRKIPFGCYLGSSPIPGDDHKAFADWLRANAEKYRTEYAEDFRWEALLGETVPV